MSQKSFAEPLSHFENRLQAVRRSRGLSQNQLATLAGITRQAVCAIEGDQYLPTTAVALRLAGVLGCRVEDLFRLAEPSEFLEGSLAQPLPGLEPVGEPVRVKAASVNGRYVVRAASALGEVLSSAVPADGLIEASGNNTWGRNRERKVRIRLLRSREQIDREIAVAGCDPSIYLTGEHLQRAHHASSLVGWTLGSVAALEALKRGEVHIAGLHLVDARTGESNLPYLRRHLRDGDYLVVTFAAWEEGLVVPRGNPKGIRDVAALARRDVRLVNRETGSGARLLLDRKLSNAGVPRVRVKGYGTTVGSHFHVARVIAEGHADVGIGVRAAARFFGCDFLPLQQARYDLVVPKAYLQTHPPIEHIFDTIVSRTFRSEIEALGGYDTSETGTVRSLREPASADQNAMGGEE